MERHLKADTRMQLAYTADQWRRTEDEANQKRVLQSLTDYTKLFFGRLEKPQSVLYKADHEPRLISHIGSEVKSGNEKKTGVGDTTIDVQSSLVAKTPENHTSSQRQRSKPHVYNPSLNSGQKQKNENLESVIHIQKNRMELEDLVRVFDEEIVRSGVDMSHPTQFCLVPGSGHLLYSAAEYLASIAHVLSAARFVNAGACDIEQSVLRWVSDIVGYPQQARGITVSGTSMGVIVAFSTARHVKLENSNQFSRSVVYMTDLAHPCNTRALRIVGLTDVVLRRVPTRKYRMDAGKLEEMITADIEDGLLPFMVIGTIGTTSLGVVDPLGAISEVAQKHGLWFHVDAAIGGLLMLDESVRRRCEGVHMADSVAMDFHKSLSAPYGTAAVLLRNGNHLRKTMARDSAPYLADSLEEEYSPLDLSFEFTRPFRAFPVWAMLKTLGSEMIKSAIQEKVKLTEYAYKTISDLKNVVTCMAPDLTVIAFRCVPSGSEDGNYATRKWHELIAEEGQICLTPTTVDGLFYIRLCILSFRSHIEDVETALVSIKRNLAYVLSGSGNEE
ncbi:tryptophan decarboxylase-like [Liolophura sinensis]|uniref:tryptophan decarboxylase-like n=1 Tax=Liolophura sinensis TaxID=3198878 RepID=UPI003158DB44